MAYVIEKGVPIPDPLRRDGVANTFRSMDVGDSFVLDRPQTSIGSYMTKNKPKQYRTKKIDNNSCRVWRVA